MAPRKKSKILGQFRLMLPGDVMYMDAHDKDITSYSVYTGIKVTTERGYFINAMGETTKIVKVTAV